jgi:DNA-binding NarL/FixJ family response regulator
MTDVFIISKYILFDRGLEKLLCQKAGLKVVGRAIDPEQALQKIEELRPGVVIIYDDTPPNHLVSNSSPKYAPTIVIDILEANPQIKVIGLSVHSNNFHVYRATRQVAQSVTDLVKAIKN